MKNKDTVWITSRPRKGKTAYDLRWWDVATGKYRSRCVGTDIKRAQREAALLEEQLNKGSYHETRQISWADFVSEHIAHMDARPATVADTDRTLKMFGEACGHPRPCRITFSTIERFVACLREKGNEPTTRNKRVRYLKGAFNMAVERGYMAKNPIGKRWRWAPEEKRMPRTLDDEERAKLLAACPTEQWRTFVVVALCSGCRSGELISLTWDKVNLDKAVLTISDTKAHKDRRQPITPDAVDRLRRLQASTLKDGGPFRSFRSPDKAAKMFRGIVESAGIARCTIHDLRKTFCTDLLERGINQTVVQALADHSSSATTSRYYQAVVDRTKREAVAKLTAAAG